MLESTTLLFHDEPYERSATSVVEDIARDEKGNLFVVLAETLMYPQGGGQMGDRGSLELAGDLAIPIVDTRKDGGVVRHYVGIEESLLSAASGAPATVELDWAHRYQQMRIHSAAHLIHCFVEQIKGESLPPPRQSPLSPDGGENQYDYCDRFDADDVALATRLMNEFVASESHPIVTRADNERGDGFRWWFCEDWAIPCGGVHPRDAAEIGEVHTEFRIKKGKIRLRIALAQ